VAASAYAHVPAAGAVELDRFLVLEGDTARIAFPYSFGHGSIHLFCGKGVGVIKLYWLGMGGFM
jgi:hypothetical protein